MEMLPYRVTEIKKTRPLMICGGRRKIGKWRVCEPITQGQLRDLRDVQCEVEVPIPNLAVKGWGLGVDQDAGMVLAGLHLRPI